MNRRVGSNVRPKEIEMLQGKKLVNFDVQEIVEVKDGVDTVSYTYEQLRLQSDAPQELIDKEVAKRMLVVESTRLKDTVGKLTVTTTNGNTFDANPQARADLADGILASETMGITENMWRLDDNTEVMVGITELREAHVLALQAYADAKMIGK